MTTPPLPREIVREAIGRLFGEKDATAIDDFFGPVYTQHSALGVDGLDGIRTLLAGLPENFEYTLVRVLGDGDLVVTHGLYAGFGPAPVVGFDVWRVDAQGRIVEHWDALAPAAGGDSRGAVDGPVSPDEAAPTDRNRELARGALPAASDDLVEHTAAWALAPAATTRGAVRQLIADGDFLFARAEGTVGETTVILNDLWRLDDMRAVEHWSLVAPVPARLPHANGVF